MNTNYGEIPPRVNELKRFFRVLFSRRIVTFSFMVILLIIITAIFAPGLAPHDPYEQNLRQALLQPSGTHLLGTDSLGRDLFSRLIFGTRNSLIVGLIGLGVAAFFGIILGLLAGYFTGRVNTIIMGFIDALMCFPMIILALLIATLLGSGLRNVVIALGIAMMPGYARLMYGQTLSIKENTYIVAERSMGSSNMRIIFRHIFPNCLPALIVLATLQIGAVILAEAGLSFLGIGVEPPAAGWGLMVADGRSFLLTNPLLSFAPGLAIMLVVFAFNMVGDGIRDAFDPRLRGMI